MERPEDVVFAVVHAHTLVETVILAHTFNCMGERVNEEWFFMLSKYRNEHENYVSNGLPCRLRGRKAA